MTEPSGVAHRTPTERRALRRVAFSSLLGTTIEYYDFLLYGTMAAVVFGKVFFPSSDSALGTIAAFGTLAAGYVARPLGGVIFGHFGDRLGRKSMLIVTMTGMGIASALIGVLPTYESVGIVAPILLVTLRVLQGIAVGGEWGGAALMVVEHADPHTRGRWAGIMQLGTPFGFLLSTGVVSLMTSLHPEAMLTWGWRVPFLFSAVLLVIGLYVRLQVVESPIFEEAAEKHEQRRVPALQVLARPGRVLIAIAAGVGPFALTALTSSHIIAYSTSIGYETADVMNCLIAVVAVSIVFIPLFAALSDKLGRRRVMLFGCVGTIAFAFPLYMLVNTGTIAGLLGGLMFAQFLQNAMYAPLTPLLSELFPTRIRYSGVSISYQFASLIGAGFTPLIASSLVASFGGSSVPLSLIAGVTALVSLLALAITRETTGRALDWEEGADTVNAPARSDTVKPSRA
ncbi:MFS transporter [Rhodococcus sp. HNM0569]|uniref:MFS transporter n=1 Tax=Rhodococcus sp. HNM0569 TaxID=2716340 RepID=UPI001469CCD7|nr:MFS transporter [Rhodococcus sp. HNM0569]NLU83737.1 MHS family MFS transporter [Rhodococcus sp. HNM0569]